MKQTLFLTILFTLYSFTKEFSSGAQSASRVNAAQTTIINPPLGILSVDTTGGANVIRNSTVGSLNISQSQVTGLVSSLSTKMAYSDTTSLSNRVNQKVSMSAVRDSARAAFTAGNNVSITGGVVNVTSAFSSIYDKTGLITNNGKYFCDTFTISTATPTISLSSYLSAAGCTGFKLNSAVAYRSGASTSSSPNVTVTALTSNSVTLILNQTNTATVTILGINVLSGLPLILVPDPTNVKVVLSFIMY